MSLIFLINKIKRVATRVVFRAVQLPRILAYRLLPSAKLLGRPTLYQPMQATGLGVIEFKGTVKIGVHPSPFFFSSYAYIEARNISASISIGHGSWINNNFCAIAEHSSIVIGERVLIGTGVEIYDSDFHGIRIPDRGRSDPSWARPVKIGSDVFLGSNVRVLKGVSIGDGSVIAGGSIVSKDIPSGVIAAGNPAKVVRSILQI